MKPKTVRTYYRYAGEDRTAILPQPIRSSLDLEREIGLMERSGIDVRSTLFYEGGGYEGD